MANPQNFDPEVAKLIGLSTGDTTQGSLADPVDSLDTPKTSSFERDLSSFQRQLEVFNNRALKYVSNSAPDDYELAGNGCQLSPFDHRFIEYRQIIDCGAKVVLVNYMQVPLEEIKSLSVKADPSIAETVSKKVQSGIWEGAWNSADSPEHRLLNRITSAYYFRPELLREFYGQLAKGSETVENGFQDLLWAHQNGLLEKGFMLSMLYEETFKGFGSVKDEWKDFYETLAKGGEDKDPVQALTIEEYQGIVISSFTKAFTIHPELNDMLKLERPFPTLQNNQ